MYPTNEKEALEALKGDDAELAATAEAILWRAWHRSGNPETDRLFRAGVDAMQQNRLAEAEQFFGELVRMAPDFAEAWNKRATVLYLVGEFERSHADVETVLKLEPRHFGALSGLGLLYIAEGDAERALDAFRRALAVNPTMPGPQRWVEELKQSVEGQPI